MKELFSGFSIEKQKDYAVCHIESLSEELKTLIRKNFCSICHGAAVLEDADSEDEDDIYSYRSTIESFLERYEDKKEDVKKGIIGELLSHIVINEIYDNFEVVSAFFNLEEKSMRKGFDLILYSPLNSSTWITEVKSGTLHKNKNVDQTTADFLSTAKGDLYNRLNKKEKMYWYNAVTAARNAVEEEKSYKKALRRFLSESGKAANSGRGKSSDHCVVLVSNLFEPLKNKITKKPVTRCLNRVVKEKKFKDVIVISVQKNTFSKIVDFLKSEIA